MNRALMLSEAAAALCVALALGCQSGGENGTSSGDADVTITLGGGLQTPESVLHDSEADVYLVSNINGSPFGKDGAGFISRVRADGSVEALKWIDGSAEGVELNAPKGMAIVGETLYVTDVTVVRKFDRGSGKPLGSIPVEGATFLNDLTAGPDGTLYVSDTGMAEGFQPTGTDAIHSIEAGGEVKTLAKGAELGQPNGILADGDSLLVVTWTGGTLSRLGPDGKLAEVARLPENQLDGIVKDGKGDWLVSSWAGSCIYRVTSEPRVSVAIGELNAPADLGFDKKRGRLLIPFFQDNKVLIRRP